MSDDIRLIVEKCEIKNWTGVTITQALDQAADAFSVQAPFDPKRMELRQAFRPFGYQPVQVYLDNDRVLTGTVDKIEIAISATDRILTVTGRSLAAAAVDCSIEGELEYSGLTLYTIARQVLKPFGVTPRGDNDTDPLEIARAEYGQKVYDFLNRLAAPRNLLLYSAPDGKLVISWARWLKREPAQAALIEGESSLLSVSASFDGSQRFRCYKAATQFAGETDIEGEVTDIGISAHRPYLSVEGDMDADPRQTAARKRTEALAAALSVTATVTGWRAPGGKPWTKGGAVTLQAPSAMLYREAKYTIVSATLKIDTTEGKITELRLMLPEVLGGEMPEVTPWV